MSNKNQNHTVLNQGQVKSGEVNWKMPDAIFSAEQTNLNCNVEVLKHPKITKSKAILFKCSFCEVFEFRINSPVFS
jgi:hypothetical protein